MSRGHFSPVIRQTLIFRAGAKCARPECGRATVGPSKNLGSKAQVLGEAAHICGASPGGARYDSEQSDEERHGVENGLWLCERCAAAIDKNGGADFSVEELKLWKRASERAALERLNRHADQVRDNCVESLIYINIPRLHHYAGLSNQSTGLPHYFDDGIPGEGYIAPQLYGLEQAIARLRFPAFDWQEAIGLVDDPTGMLVSFEGRFRTKNGPDGSRDRAERDLSNYKTAPHIYQKGKGTTLILPYDPKFVTTCTAMVELTSGQVRVGGFASVKFRKGDEVIASPFIIGLASTPEARAFMRSLSQSQEW
jgi:hypothetical protein